MIGAWKWILRASLPTIFFSAVPVRFTGTAENECAGQKVYAFSDQPKDYLVNPGNLRIGTLSK
jgi:hypothetical protein